LTDASGGLALSQSPEGVAFWIAVHPRSRRPRVGGLQGDALRVAVAEPPVEGRANEACRRALAEALGVGRNAVHVDPAARSRRKRVRIAGDAAELEAALRRLASAG
jgi:uncharacterized protein